MEEQVVSETHGPVVDGGFTEEGCCGWIDADAASMMSSLDVEYSEIDADGASI